MYLWGETFRDDEFATEVNKVIAKDISIVMEQCYSGGFVDDLAGQNRVIMTACASNETSCGMGYYTYDEFVFDWIAAVTDEDPNGNAVNADYNNDGFISMQEAFYYADTNDACSETPQYSFTPTTLGTSLAIDGLIPYLSGASFVCSSSATFTVNNDQGATVSWTCSTNISFDHQTGNPKTFTANSTGTGTIQAILTSNCGNVTLPAQTVWVGTPVITSISGPASVGTNQPASFTAQLSLDSSPTSYYWTTSPSSGVTIYPDSRYASMSFANSGTYQVVARAQNSCGWSDYFITYVDVTDGYYLAISPNPTTTEATIELVSTSTEKATKEIEWDLEVYDAMQTMKAKVQKIKTNEHNLNTSGWKDGVYMVRAKVESKIITGKLVVKQ